MKKASKEITPAAGAGIDEPVRSSKPKPKPEPEPESRSRPKPEADPPAPDSAPLSGTPPKRQSVRRTSQSHRLMRVILKRLRDYDLDEIRELREKHRPQ